MTKWAIEVHHVKTDEHIPYLKQMGKAGWEPWHLAELPVHNEVIIWFKRPVDVKEEDGLRSEGTGLHRESEQGVRAVLPSHA